MIFFNKYKINLSVSRYDALKLFLDNFSKIDSDADFDKMFFGVCDDGTFRFKTTKPTAATYAYAPSCRLSVDCDENNNAVLDVKSKAPLLLAVFVMAVICAVLFVMMYALTFNARLFIGTGVSLLIAFAFAFVSCKRQIKIKQKLASIYSL